MHQIQLHTFKKSEDVEVQHVKNEEKKSEEKPITWKYSETK